MNHSKIVVVILLICIYLLRIDILKLLLLNIRKITIVDKLSTEIDNTANDNKTIIDQSVFLDRLYYTF